jgi:pimeloyl-ACP methyl ester carboxylesterase
VDDLIEVIGGRDVVVVGHSYGGNIVLGAALDRRGDSIRAVAAYEPPQPWLRQPVVDGAASRPGGDSGPSGESGDGKQATSAVLGLDDPGAAAERFFRRMVGEGAWDRLPEKEKAGRRADGPALTAELAAIRLREPPFDVRALRIPVVYGRGSDSLPHHRQAVAWLVAHTPEGELFEIAGGRHGAHLTHPDAFASMVRRAVARSGRPSATRP